MVAVRKDRRSADAPLRFFPARQNGLEMWRLFFGSDDADFNLLETGGFEPAVPFTYFRPFSRWRECPNFK